MHMEVCKYANMQVCKVSKYTSNVSIQVYSMQVYMYSSLHLCKYVGFCQYAKYEDKYMQVTAEICLTNVTVIVGICLRWSKESQLQCLVIVEPVTAEIFLIWKIVARTIVAWTYVNMTVGICSRGFQEPTISWIEVESVLSDLTHSQFQLKLFLRVARWVGGLLDQMEIKPTQPQLKLS